MDILHTHRAASISLALHIPLERNSQSATAERLSAPNGKFVVS